jgi:small subunit ribosomal protein S1
MSTKVTYGNESDISIFQTNTSKYVIQNGKLLSNESYIDELLPIYNTSFTKLTNTSLQIGDVVTGFIEQISKKDLILDVGGKEMVYVSIKADKLNPTDYKIGQELSVVITDNKDFIRASSTEYTKQSLYSEMKDSDNKKVYDAYVVCLTDNGYTLNIDGVNVFMPGSLGGINKLLDFNSLVGQTIKVIPIKNENKYSKYKDQLIVSHREYLNSLIPNEIEKLEIGKVYTGKVTDTCNFGVFVEFQQVLTGLIHQMSFDEQLQEMFNQGKITPGTEISFYLKEIVTNKKIILTRLASDFEELSKPKYEINQIVPGTVVKTVKYGSFISLGNNITGMIHISNMKKEIELKPKDVVQVKILSNKNGKYDLELV